MYKFTTALFLFVLTGILHAQVTTNLEPNKELSQYILKNWNTQNGLPANALQDIIQTKDGYIWLASYGGLSRFDGVHFENFSIKNHNLPSETLQCITVDSNQVVWVGTINGIFQINKGKVAFDNRLSVLNNKSVETVFTDNHGNVWFGLSIGGIYKWDGHHIEKIPTHPDIEKQVVSGMSQDNAGNIYIGTEIGDLFEYKNAETQKILTAEQTNGIYTIDNRAPGHLYIGAGNGVYKIKNGVVSKLEQIQVVNVQDLMEDQNQMLWLATLTGMYRYDLKTAKQSVFNEDNGLPNNIVYKLMTDNEGNVWGATYRQGLFRLTGGQFLCYSTLEGLPSNIVIAIDKYKDNAYLMATEDAQLMVFKDQQFAPFQTKAPIPLSRLKHIMFDSKQQIWISTYGGLMVIDKDDNWTLYNEENGFEESLFRYTFEDNHGNVWAGTRRRGVFKFQTDGQIKNIGTEHGLNSDYVMSITIDKKQRLVVGTKGGINIIENDKIVEQYSSANGLVSDFVFNVYVDKQNVMWACSNSGIDRIEGNQIHNFSIKQGLNNNSVFDIVEDEHGNFWLPTPKGVMQAKKSEFEEIIAGKRKLLNTNFYGKEAGLKNNECIGATKTFQDSDETIGFLTMGGVSFLNPNNLTVNTIRPKLRIESISLDSLIIDFNQKITIEPHVKRIVIKYTAFSYKAPHKLKFKYKLEPYDNVWIEGDANRTAQYTSLPAGKYTFQLKAANNDGVWTDQALEFQIISKPYFYQTFWFIGLAILVIVALGFALYRNRVKAYEKRNQILEQKVTERTAEVEQQKEEIIAQKEMVEEQNKKIQATNEHIHSSIVYARTIQNAILPLPRHMNTNFETFTIFRPKDIVSGDFFWLNFKKGQKYTYYAAVDCTGHGVPGAFMSMVGSHLLAEIVSVRGVLDPAEILTRLDDYTYNSLQQNISENTDGMDLALVRLERKENNQTEVVFCGAKRPLFYYSQNAKKLLEIKGNRKSIAGKKRNSKNIPFTNHTLTLETNDILYLTTDGFTDQNNEKRQRYSSKRLKQDLQSIANYNLAEQKRYLENELDAWQAAEPQRDDITLIGIKI